jgi:hypothetical protein
MGVFNTVAKIADKTVSLIDQTVIDQDKAIELKTDLI